MPKKKEPEMIPARKLPKYICVEKSHPGSRVCLVYITRRMANTVPEWVRERHMQLWFETQGEHRGHAFTYIAAKDELEAYTRFCRVWQGLPTE